MNDTLPTQLRNDGVVLLRNAFAHGPLLRLKEAACRCFQALESGPWPSADDRFSRSSHSVLLGALLEFGIEGEEDLLAPLFTPALPGGDAALPALFSEALGHDGQCRLEQSWIRKKFPPGQAPGPGYHLQDWHQDGALGVRFPLQAGPAVPMNELLTCWIPLQACGVDAPGLEFIRGRQSALLHFTELADPALRRRFESHQFWKPSMELGDGLVFLRDVLHRTHVDSRMSAARLSVEYRIFPGGKA